MLYIFWMIFENFFCHYSYRKTNNGGKTSYMCICGIFWWTHWMWMSFVSFFYVVQFLPFGQNERKESKNIFYFNYPMIYSSPSLPPFFIPTSSFNPLWFSNLLSTHIYLLTNNNKGFLLEVMVDLTMSANNPAGFNYLFSLLKLIGSVWKPKSARKIMVKINVLVILIFLLTKSYASYIKPKFRFTKCKCMYLLNVSTCFIFIKAESLTCQNWSCSSRHWFTAPKKLWTSESNLQQQ